MPDDLSALAAQLDTKWIGRPHEHHGTIGSTNDRALEWANDAAPHGALVTADHQSAGRGRRGRGWSSVAGTDIYGSVILRPPNSPHLSTMSLVAGIGLRQGIQEFTGEDVGLKWPNDLVVGDRKLGGILCETRWGEGEVVLVVGFGINVARTDFTADLDPIATSLARLGRGFGPGRADVLVACLRGLEEAVGQFFRRGFPAMRPAYEANCKTLRRWVRVHQEGSLPRRVWAERVDDDGALLVRLQGGTALERVESGEVSLSMNP